jgi:hypothetical protein
MVALPQVSLPKRPLAKYLLLHDSRFGLKVHPFESRSNLQGLLGLVVPDDLLAGHKDLLKFLGITMEFNDHIVVIVVPASEGEWERYD